MREKTVDEKIEDMRVLKGSLIIEFEALERLRRTPADTIPQQQKALEQIHEYQAKWKELVRGTYIPEAQEN